MTFFKKNSGCIRVLVLSLLMSTVLQVIVLGSIALVKRENKEQDARLYAQSVASSIQLTLENSLNATKSLKYIYSLYGEDCFNDFDSISRAILKDNPTISSIYIAPDGIIGAAYPLEISNATLGFDMLSDPEQGPRAQLAKDTHAITVAGPHTLVEGGVGLIIRNPVYIDGEFKGFTIIVLNWDDFVEQIFKNVKPANREYRFAVWKSDRGETAVSDKDGFIFRNSSKSISNKVDVSFRVPNDVWHLIIEPEDGWLVYNEMLFPSLISVSISLMLVTLIVFLYISDGNKKRLEQELAANATKSLYMKRLSDALDKAEKADAAKSSFLSRMSHDIRTPLNGLIGLMQINEKHADNRQLVDENRKKAFVAANHLLSLISDVLELSRIEDGDIILSEEPFNIIELVRDVITISELRASEAGITLDHSFCDDIQDHPYVFGSPLHLRQILINIIGNSIKYNKPNGSISFRADMVSISEDIVIYSVTISDTGIGMSPEFLKHLYEPFSQEHSDARSTYQGTGLGMSIVKGLLDKMHGSIDVTSEVGVGSTFIITIPFKIASADDLPDNTASERADINGINILIAEDNDLNMEIARELLTDAGAIVTEARNGKEAVELFTTNPAGSFDVIIMDLMMPVMNGFAATAAIRSSDRPDSESIPIIAMTANAFAEDAQKCYSAGMNGHMAKPFKIEELTEIISSLISRK